MMKYRAGTSAGRRLSRRSGLLAFSGLGAGLVACGPGGGGVPAGGSGGQAGGQAGGQGVAGTSAAPRRLRIGTSFVVANMLPAAAPQWHSTYGIAQTLYRILPGDKLAPWIATSIDQNGTDGYTIKLNPRAKFHSGKPIDAKAVQGSLEYHIARGIAVPSLRGARYETPDATTLKVLTSQPDPWLPSYLATAASFPIFDPAEVNAQSDPVSIVTKGFYSGPFRTTSLTPQRLTLDAVPDAWDGAPRLAGVDVVFVQDPQARFTALRTGELDLLLYTPAEAVPIIKQTPALSFKGTPTAELVWVQLNHKRAPFDELPVRQALALSIDRKPLAERVLSGAYDAPDSIYPSSLPYALPGVLKTDLAGARRLLDGAGWMAGSDGIRVKAGRRLGFELLHYPQQPDSKPMAEAVQAQLKAVGMEVRLKQSDDITGTFRSKDYEAGIRYNSMQKTGNPMSVLNQSFLTDSVGNEGGWGSAELDTLIKRLNVEFDVNRRNDLLKQLQQVFQRDIPITFTVSKHWSAAVNADFADYVPSHDNHAYVVTKDTAPSARK
jgi:peptide/nickel transport system substrate-binding protein